MVNIGKRKRKRQGRMVGVHMPKGIIEAVCAWVGADPERSISMFIRSAVREKISKEGIKVHEDQTTNATR